MVRDDATVGGRLPARPPLLRMLALLWLAVAAIRLGQHLAGATTHGLASAEGIAFGDDLVNFWATPRLALEGRIADIYDFARYHAFQQEALGGRLHLYHYSYPPTAILLTLPLGLLPYPVAWAVWFGGGLLVFVHAVRCAWPGQGRRGDAVLYALAVPAVFVNALTGQTGTWMAGLLGGGLLLLARRPLLAGVLLGLATVKPQLVLLVPLALLAARQWRALAGFAATALILLLASLAAFGIEPWLAYRERVPILQGWILEQGDGVWHLMVSLFVAVRHWPAPVATAYAAQAILAALAAAAVIAAWSGRGAQPAKNAVLLLCAMIATPYVQAYDLVATALVPLWLWRCGTRGDEVWLAATALLAAPVVAVALATTFGIGGGFVFLLPMLAVALLAVRRTASPAT